MQELFRILKENGFSGFFLEFFCLSAYISGTKRDTGDPMVNKDFLDFFGISSDIFGYEKSYPKDDLKQARRAQRLPEGKPATSQGLEGLKNSISNIFGRIGVSGFIIILYKPRVALFV